jgi:hypothetical protein
MQDFQEKYKKLILEADDCDLIARLATDADKREAFRKLAEQTRAMAAELQQIIAGLPKE